MTDNFEHKIEKIELPEPQQPVHRLSVPGGWLYAWAGGVTFVAVNPYEDIPRTAENLRAFMHCNRMEIKGGQVIYYDAEGVEIVRGQLSIPEAPSHE